MEKTDFIATGPLPLPSMDFGLLLETGMRACQQLSGAHWTDFNAHDPGLTILEQLCYALSDVAYRLDFPVADLLAPPPGAGADRYSTLFSGDRILSSQPLTVRDYRKLLYDRVHKLRNVWLRPESGSAARRTSRPAACGLYRIRVEPFGDGGTTLESDVRRCYLAHRNLGEDLAGITMLRPCPVEVGGLLDLEPLADPAAVLAQVRFAIQEMLTPTPRVLALDAELATQGPEAAFDGPLLELGGLDIPKGALRSTLSLRDLRACILAVPGVCAVSNLRMAAGGPEFADERACLALPDEACYFCLAAPGAGTIALTVRWKGEHYPIDEARLTRLLEGLDESSASAERRAEEQVDQLAYRRVAAGTWRDPQRYYSIQHQFPQVYGIGPHRLDGVVGADTPWREDAPGHDPAGANAAGAAVRRRAQALQLKAYLLFFEQVLANHLAQVGNLGRLFSADPHLTQSYFSQPLAAPAVQAGECPDVREVLMPPQAHCGTGAGRHGYSIQVFGRGGRGGHQRGAAAPLLLRSVESEDPFDAAALEAVLIAAGRRRGAYRATTLPGGRIHLTLCDEHGAPLGYYARRCFAGHSQRRAIGHLMAWLGRLAEDAELRQRHVRRLAWAGGAPACVPAPADSQVAYAEELQKLVGRFDPFLARRNRFLNHLLARFNEEFDDQTLARLDLRGRDGADAFFRDLIGWKSTFLQHYAPLATPQQDSGAPADSPWDDLGGRRSIGADYASADSRSGFELRLRLLLGVANGVLPGHAGGKAVAGRLYAGEDMVVVEHVLLRERHDGGAPASSAEASRITIVFPAWPPRFERPEFRQFAAHLAAKHCPAHLALRCVWLDSTAMEAFGHAHLAWRHLLAGWVQAGDGPAASSCERVDRAAQALWRFLAERSG